MMEWNKTASVRTSKNDGEMKEKTSNGRDKNSMRLYGM